MRSALGRQPTFRVGRLAPVAVIRIGASEPADRLHDFTQRNRFLQALDIGEVIRDHVRIVSREKDERYAALQQSMRDVELRAPTAEIQVENDRGRGLMTLASHI